LGGNEISDHHDGPALNQVALREQQREHHGHHPTVTPRCAHAERHDVNKGLGAALDSPGVVAHLQEFCAVRAGREGEHCECPFFVAVQLSPRSVLELHALLSDAADQ
jgi:hypothetical protein